MPEKSGGATVKQSWDAAELSAWWSLSFEERGLIEALESHARLGFAVQLKFYRHTGRFADRAADIPAEPVVYLAEQVEAAVADMDRYGWTDRTGRRHRHQILKHLGIRHMVAADRQDLSNWLSRDICPSGASADAMIEQAYLWCRDHSVQSPVPKVLARQVRATRQDFETKLFMRVAAGLEVETIAKMEGSLAEPAGPTGFNGLNEGGPGPDRAGEPSRGSPAACLHPVAADTRLGSDLCGVSASGGVSAAGSA